MYACMSELGGCRSYWPSYPRQGKSISFWFCATSGLFSRRNSLRDTYQDSNTLVVGRLISQSFQTNVDLCGLKRSCQNTYGHTSAHHLIIHNTRIMSDVLKPVCIAGVPPWRYLSFLPFTLLFMIIQDWQSVFPRCALHFLGQIRRCHVNGLATFEIQVIMFVTCHVTMLDRFPFIVR